MINDNTKVAVLGLGYVGFPLALEFGKKFKTVGIDKNISKIQNYKNSIDPSCEVESQYISDVLSLGRISFTHDLSNLKEADFIIVAVPTPVSKNNTPDLSILESAAFDIGNNLSDGTTIIFESTVYPGATENICIPIIEQNSKKVWKKDFNVGYSPERINPGDKTHSVKDIVKIVSGDTQHSLKKIANLYSAVIDAGVFKAKSISVAEAAKVIENVQRDLNIALVNELSKIFDILKIPTNDVLEAADTKWNFSRYQPGLVGGHCIGVDPYYLTYIAEKNGYNPEVILAGRNINESMSEYVAKKSINLISNSGRDIKLSKILIFGITYKENCSDIRNSKIIDLIKYLEKDNCNIEIIDPVVDVSNVSKDIREKIVNISDIDNNHDLAILAVPHNCFLDEKKYTNTISNSKILVDIKGAFKDSFTNTYWSL